MYKLWNQTIFIAQLLSPGFSNHMYHLHELTISVTNNLYVSSTSMS